jgi:membrane protein
MTVDWFSKQLMTLRRTVERAWSDGVKDLASSIAFFTFFGIFPFLLLVVAAAGYMLDSEQAQSHLYRMIEESFPVSGDLVRDNVTAVTRARGSATITGMVGLLWASSAAFGAITRAINRVMGAGKARSFVHAKLRYLVMAITVSLLLVVSVALSGIVELLITREPAWFTLLGLGSGTVTWTIGWSTSLLILFLMFALIYKEAPAHPPRWRDVLPGAALAAVITEIGKIGFLTYLERVADFEALFGSLTSIMVLLLWLYLAAVALIVGIEYNMVRAEQKTAQPVVGMEVGEFGSS